ncbi:uncharacterized protein LOC129717137 [Wyeomyia smithii]|uniref:uncharacterized protein LOC129717137 n=1 Tax=Wyeomyia smithii TaxID=174621 RepID=UPI002467F95A|nr:uncharacterized protein LOC129717137 [Wyeomyia smithii]
MVRQNLHAPSGTVQLLVPKGEVKLSSALIEWIDTPHSLISVAQSLDLSPSTSRHLRQEICTRDIAPRLTYAPEPLVKSITHHPALSLTFDKLSSIDYHEPEDQFRYDFKRADYEGLLRELHNVDWVNSLNPTNVDMARKEAGLPPVMELATEKADNLADICRLFAAKFSSVFCDESLSTSQIFAAANKVAFSSSSIASINIDDRAISAAVTKLKHSNSPGPDGIPATLLKKCISGLLTPLTHLFRLSIALGSFPSAWKQAFMFPVHKKGDRSNIASYRGISALCATSKLFEIVDMEPIYSHCQNVIAEEQHGFLPKRSCATNLICFTGYVIDGFVERAQTDAIYTDLSAAFDKINHRIAIAKLDRKNNPLHFEYNLTGVQLQRVDHVKDLGIILDTKITFKQHVSFIIAKASRQLGLIIRMTRDFRNIHCLVSLYNSLVRSCLEYCCPVWVPYYNNSIHRIESIQRRFTRFALRLLPWRQPLRNTRYEDRCQLLHIDTLQLRRETARTMVVSDTLTG